MWNCNLIFLRSVFYRAIYLFQTVAKQRISNRVWFVDFSILICSDKKKHGLGEGIDSMVLCLFFRALYIQEKCKRRYLHGNLSDAWLDEGFINLFDEWKTVVFVKFDNERGSPSLITFSQIIIIIISKAIFF